MLSNGSKYGRFIGIFILGCILFCYPILSIFNKKSVLFGIPVLIVYIFAAWAGLLLMIHLASRTSAGPPAREDKAKPPEQPPVLFDSVG